MTHTAQPAASRAARLIASLGGLGHVGIAPGTLGSLAGIASGAAILHAGRLPLAACTAAATIAGLAAVAASGAARQDPCWIIIDELAGQWLTMLPLAHPGWLGLALAFGLFRLFDIAKPGPIGWLDRRPGALGVMGDDLLAGAAAALVIAAVGMRWPELLG